MSIFIPAILSELTSRSLSFLIDKISKPSAAPTVEEALNSLQRLLLRAQVIIEEAEGRLVVNQAMLQLLNQLREEMYRGHHKLDTYVCRANKDQASVQDQAVSPSFIPSNLKPAKRIRFHNPSSSKQELINKALDSLEMAITDATELIVFLSGCPRLYRQPYNMYLLLNNCMFGRQMEMERIMNFLLQEDIPGAEFLGILPVIGPGKVGKTTIIEQACRDDRVRNRFSQIVCFRQHSIKDDKKIATLSDCDMIKHHDHAIENEKILVIIELMWEIDEGAWREFYSDCKQQLSCGSKIIVARRSERIARFGTTQALRVQFFSPEAYWYFFKVRTFGSTNTEDHPKLAAMAMEMARELNGCFFCAHVYTGMLKTNFNAQFWRMALASIKEFKGMNLFLYDSDILDPWQIVKPVYMKKTCSEYLVVLDDYQTVYAQSPNESGVPILNIEDVIFWRVRCRGKFKVLAWTSHLPPHYSYMLDCEARRPQRGMVSRKKRFQEAAS